MRYLAAAARLVIEATLFLAVALVLLVITLQRDAPTKFIYYNF
jgi:hypothetical protein